MECKFFVGQKVVCVDSDPDPRYPGPQNMPVSGCVYTVAWVGPYQWTFDSGIGVILAEHKRPAPLAASRFRPAYDIQQFRDIAEKARKTGRVTVDA